MQAPGAAAASTVISFAQKTFANGNLTSKLHVIELGAAPGLHLWAPFCAPALTVLQVMQLLAASYSAAEMQHAASKLAAGASTVDSSGKILHVHLNMHVLEMPQHLLTGRRLAVAGTAPLKKQAELFFPPEFADDFPVAMQISEKYGLVYVITKLGLLFVYDLQTATAVYRNRISPDPIFLTASAPSSGGFYAINR